MAEDEDGIGLIRLERIEIGYGPSPKVIATSERAARLVNRYPDAEAELLRREIARIRSVQIDRIVLGSGAGEILRAAVQTLTGRGHKVVMAAPGFDLFQAMVTHAGRRLASVRMVD